MSYKSGIKIFTQVISICLGSFMSGYGMGVFNPAQEDIAYQLKWSNEEINFNKGMITSGIAIGAALGALVGEIWLLSLGEE